MSKKPAVPAAVPKSHTLNMPATPPARVTTRTSLRSSSAASRQTRSR